MSFPFGAIKQLVLPIRQKLCGEIRNVRVMCEERIISTHTLHCGTCGEKISAVRKTQARFATVWNGTKKIEGLTERAMRMPLPRLPKIGPKKAWYRRDPLMNIKIYFFSKIVRGTH